MKPIRLTLIVSALAAVIGGCVAVPVDPGYYGNGYYGSAPAYYGSAPAYYGAPYYGPSIGIGIYGGRYWRDGGRNHDRRDRNEGWRGDGYRDWRH